MSERQKIGANTGSIHLETEQRKEEKRAQATETYTNNLKKQLAVLQDAKTSYEKKMREVYNWIKFGIESVFIVFGSATAAFILVADVPKALAFAALTFSLAVAGTFQLNWIKKDINEKVNGMKSRVRDMKTQISARSGVGQDAAYVEKPSLGGGTGTGAGDIYSIGYRVRSKLEAAKERFKELVRRTPREESR